MTGEVRWYLKSAGCRTATNGASIQHALACLTNGFDWSKDCVKIWCSQGEERHRGGAGLPPAWVWTLLMSVGRTKEFWVKLVQVGDTNTVDVDSGTALLFQGVFLSELSPGHSAAKVFLFRMLAGIFLVEAFFLGVCFC